MSDPRLNDEIIELVAEHLGCDTDEVEFHSADMRPEEISGQWHEASRDWSHLSKTEREAVRQRTMKCPPRMVGGAAVLLYDEVQPRKGQPRVKAAIVDFGDRCQIASY
jgi:hypothetical protein